MADASVLGADLSDNDVSRCEATTGEHTAYFPRDLSTSQRQEANRGAGTRASSATPDATCDPVKAEIDEAWDRLDDDVKHGILAMVRCATRVHEVREAD
jgi:hypothetical protein